MLKQTLFISILFLVLTGGCRSKTHIVNLQTQWSSLDPETIPLSVREKEVEKGNLITNPSFEAGRYYLADTVRLSFNLPGWKKVGEDVYWTDTQQEAFESDEASNGTHAIKIERKHADETDLQGEGIISDYIKVIPGNYRLSMDIKLSHIESAQARLGTNIYDAVNLMLFCYDKNKVMIRNLAWHPAYDKMINNSFKGLPFSNFRYIGNFGWGRVIARSGDFPFDEGNIPDDARYVRIFAGLKGTGAMWVDMVDFHYTMENFTFLEKVRPLFDSTMERAGNLLPRPQKIGEQKDMNLIKNNEDNTALKPLILIPAAADTPFRTIIRGFVDGLRKQKLYTRKEDPVVTRLPEGSMESGRLIFSFGHTDLSAQFTGHTPPEGILDREQAYYISTSDAVENVVFVGAADDQGLWHAVNTLLQLTDIPSSKYHHYDIVDYPDFENRGVLIPVTDHAGIPSGEELDFLVRCGLNEFILEPRGDRVNSGEIYPLFRKDFGVFTKRKKNTSWLRIGISLREQKYPVINETRNRDLEENLSALTSAAEKEAGRTLDDIRGYAGEGANPIIQSDEGLWNSLDLGKPGNSMSVLREEPFNKYMMVRNAFWKALKENKKDLPGLNLYLYSLFPDNRIKNQLNPGEFCYYKSVENYAGLYDYELWTGPVTRSSMIDQANFARYILNNPLEVKLFDNTLSGRKEKLVLGGYASKYPGKAATGVFFEPYDVEMVSGLKKEIHSECILNISAADELTMIRIATAADYLWNNSGYKPWISAWKVLLVRYGKETAIELVYLNDLYYKLMSLCLRLENEGYNPKLIRTGDELVVQLDAHWGNLKVLLEDDPDFLNDLSDLKNRMISRFFQAKRIPDTSTR